ncbi:MAG: hypothetical protein QOG32_818 [Chloroflexota bacterium]|nr:hypothetical protein [Chloroflexota bacterium]
MRFRTTILGGDKTAAGIQIPNEIVEALGQGKKPPVKVTIATHTFRSTVATVSGIFMVGVTNEFRKTSGVAAGDEVDVEIELDTEKREVSVPADLATALDAVAGARQYFDGLSYSNKRRIVEPINDAKSPETRQRRIDASVARLREGRI